MSSFAAWKVDASLVGPGVLLWVRKPRDTTKRGSTHDHWFVVVDVAPPGRIVAGTKLHIVGISSHPQDMAAAVPMETAGTPLKGECYACLDWELDDRLHRKGARVSYHDPYVPVCANGVGPLASVALDDTVIAQADCVVILTNHTGFPYDSIIRNARAVVDTRNVLRGQESDRLIRL